jgi:hypothetical protein
LGLVGRVPAGFCASSLARGSGQASYNPKQNRTFLKSSNNVPAKFKCRGSNFLEMSGFDFINLSLKSSFPHRGCPQFGAS